MNPFLSCSLLVFVGWCLAPPLQTQVLGMNEYRAEAASPITVEIIRDAFGRPIGRFEKHSSGEVRVYDSVGRPLGRAGRTGTFDHLGRRLSPNSVPGLLMKCSSPYVP
jgi:hypothetical protein